MHLGLYVESLFLEEFGPKYLPTLRRYKFRFGPFLEVYH
jgi:hypothetical protein